MSLIYLSLLIGLGVGVMFGIISLLYKQTDYMLDDYTESDAPESVRIIEREVQTIVEKETIKEVEKIVVDEQQITELKQTLSTFEEDKTKLEAKLQTLDTEKKNISNTLEEMTYDNSVLLSEVNDYKTKGEEETKRLKKEVHDLNSNVSKLEKNRKEYKDLFKKTKKDLDSNISDSEHFAALLSDKEKQITKLNNKLKKNTLVYEGVDEIGNFHDVYNLPVSIQKSVANKIQDISEKLEENTFGYYGINSHNGSENVDIYPISELERILLMINNNKNDAHKYHIYLIINNRVYTYHLH